MVIGQLRKYYGQHVSNFNKYEELVWANEMYTSAPFTQHVLPHQNNGHRVFQRTYMDESLYFAGTETNAAFSGYMEGAIRSAQDICAHLNTVD